MPINSLVLKVASRCNLNCSYCYMYNLGDTTYKNQPKIMSFEVVESLILGVKKYVEDNGIKYFHFIFHGGEPLLAPVSWYINFVNLSKEKLKNLQLQFSLQTNGVLYDDTYAIELKKMNIHVGFSWDGPKIIHDKFRIFHNGKGSYEELMKGMKVHKKYHDRLSGLAVINVEIEPLKFYNNSKDIGMTDFTLLFPNLHHSMKQEYNFFQYSKDKSTYGSWLCKLFEIWWSDKDPNKPNISYFNDLILLIMGSNLTNEALGTGENNVLVIETNGDIETTSSLKSCGDGFTKEGKNILQNSLEESLNAELIDTFVYSHKNLCEICENCKIKSICGGGRLNQRFSDENGFNNPSVYCNDIKLIVTKIQNTLIDEFTPSELEELNMQKIKYEDI